MTDVENPVEGTEETWREPRRHQPSLFWPLVLVGTGIVLLLSNLGYLPWQSWNILWRLWPLLLVALGIDVLIGRRSMLGTVVSGVLILMLIGGALSVALFARNIPLFVELAQPAAVHSEHVEHPLEELERAAVVIDWTSAPASLSALDDSSNLIEGDITYRGELVFDVNVHGSQADVELDSRYSGPWFVMPGFRDDQADRRWDVQLSPDVVLDLNLDAGSGRYDFDLSELQISDLVIDGGSGAIDLALPAGRSFEASIDGGSGSIELVLPEGVGARVVLDSGSGSFRPGERFDLVAGERGNDSVWESDDFDTADETIVLNIDQGSGSITIR